MQPERSKQKCSLVVSLYLLAEGGFALLCTHPAAGAELGLRD